MVTKKVAIILSGCGVYDGAEINEVVLTLLALEEGHVLYQCFAPDIDMYHTVNHISGSPLQEKRNVLIESARIVRGNVQPISECDVNDFSSLIIPGGFGVAKNLSDFAFNGGDLAINNDVLTILTAFKNAKKPVGYMCIAPVLLPLVYGVGVILTIGNDKETISVIESMGGVHHVTGVGDIVVDTVNNVVTTPAYMLASSIIEAKLGIDKLVSQVVALS
ncbi:isoprenoid biosynthesis glyoxalase ElbB [Yersinia enterocolitica]